jgi:hypothetical protein
LEWQGWNGRAASHRRTSSRRSFSLPAILTRADEEELIRFIRLVPHGSAHIPRISHISHP